MKTILIKPNGKEKQYQKLNRISAVEPPLWLACMADRYSDPILIDAEAEGLDVHDIQFRVSMHDVKEVIILCTGTHPSAHIQQEQSAQDIVDFLTDYKVSVYKHLPFDPTMTKPRFDLLNMLLYRPHNWHSWGVSDKKYGVTFTSISCPFSCDFCCIKDFYKSGYKKRDPFQAFKDIQLQYEMGITNFKIMDELFASTSGHLNKFCDYLIESGFSDKLNIWGYARIDTVNKTLLRKLRKAGVRWLGYGIESGNEEIRVKHSKGKFSNQYIKDVVRMNYDEGIHVAANYMFGFPEEGMKEINDTLELALDLNTEYANFYCYVPYDKKLKEYSQYAYEFVPEPTKHLSSEMVLRMRDLSFLHYFKHPAYQRMMKYKFGKDVLLDIQDMVSIPIKRKIYDI